MTTTTRHDAGLPLRELGDGTAAGSNDWSPAFFRPREAGGVAGLTQLLQAQAGRLRVFDTVRLQLADLIQTRHPESTLPAGELDSLTCEHLRGVPLENYGVWVYYSWSGRLVHLLDEAEFAELRTNRNLNKITAAEQSALAMKRIGIVGLSVGQSAAAVLALERAFGEIRLADFDTVDLSNLNRIRTGVHSLGVPKVYVTAREIAEIDPYLKVVLFPQGLTADNTETFLLQGGKLDVIVEECDSLDIKVLIRHRARAHGIPVVMDTSDRGMLDIERFDIERDRPIFHGLAGDLRPELLTGLTTEEKIPYVVRIIGAQTMSPRLRSSLLEVKSTVVAWPQLGSAVSLGGAAAADAARRIVLGHAATSGRYFVEPGSAAGTSVPEEITVRHQPNRPPMPRTDSIWHTLVSQAILAPSGGNSQPWEWLILEDELRLHLDGSRTSGLIDFENSGGFVALGCAAENLVLAAHATGLEIHLDLFPSFGDPGHVATFRRAPAEGEAETHWRDELHARIGLRHTCRNLGRRQGLGVHEQAILTEAVRSVPGAAIQWITHERDLAEIGQLVGEGDRLRMLNQRTHGEMFSELRWTSEEAESRRDGIEIDALELTPSDRAGVELCRDWSTLQLVQDLRGGRNLEKISRKQVAAAAAVGLITLPAATPGDYFNGGRALQRMWLAASERNIAIHPMTVLPYFFARLIRGNGGGFDPYTIEQLQAARTRYEHYFQVTASTAEVMLFRVGFAQTTTKPSLRRPVDEVLKYFNAAPTQAKRRAPDIPALSSNKC